MTSPTRHTSDMEIEHVLAAVDANRITLDTDYIWRCDDQPLPDGEQWQTALAHAARDGLLKTGTFSRVELSSTGRDALLAWAQDGNQ